MIYRFAYQKKEIGDLYNIDEVRGSKTIKTRQTYIRELLTFYNHLCENKQILLEDTFHTDSESILRIIEPRHVLNYQKWLISAPLGRKKEPYKKTTIAKKTVILKGFFKYLHEQKFTEFPLHHSLVSANITRIDLPNRDVTYDEVKQILEYYKDSPLHYTILLTLATTGLRAAELASAKWRDITKDHNGHWLKIMGKGRKEREVFIIEYVFDAIVKFRKRRGQTIELNSTDNSYLIVTSKMKPYSPGYLSKFVSEMIARTKLPFINNHDRNGFSAHFFRHSYAIEARKNGADIYAISTSLGHESIKTTQIYLAKHEKRETNVGLIWKNKEEF
ncbi:tyrosine-type recombinase/integrase [Gottfriedia solisilvae]|uniref:Tyrosine recombinase XerC n=1 Tax=Gottfriedia solisilvae TaxID=1516104 RepID=A0A8J3ANE9_9BACI|nr:tyrosine-type recombinase/integrase [Gottfriedia solisilvae]GGI17937.1 tyrosine recombinase XerC [Gottfriedia solisilvae]